MVKNMSSIKSCEVTDCSYNKHNSCHTLAITVGGPGDACPMCDTFISAAQRAGIPDVQGGVGACRVESCSYNDSLECSAPSISVTRHSGHPDCATFRPR